MTPETPTSKPVAKMTQSTSYSTPCGHDGVLGDAFDAPVVGRVHECDVVPVEGVQIGVAERGALAHVAVPGLERLGRRGVLDDGVHAVADPVHLLEVGDFVEAFALLGWQARVAVGRDELLLQPRGARPAVVHQVLGRLAAGDDGEEIVPAAPLPAGRQRCGPPRIGGAVAAHIDRGRRALEHIQMLGVPSQMGHDLDGGGAGADEGHALVGESVQSAARVAAGVVVVPAAGVERMALEGLDARDAGEFRPAECSAGDHHMARPDAVVPVGVDGPLQLGVVPAEFGHLGPEADIAVEVEVAPDRPCVLSDLLARRVAPLGYVADLLEQGR